MLSNLDKKDLAILKALDTDVRASYTQLGKKARLSKEVAQYRIKRLEEQKIITGYWTLVDRGESFTYKLLIKNRNLTQEKKQQFIDYVKNHKTVSWFAHTEGMFDYVITLNTSHDTNIALFLEKLFEEYGSYFQERHILRATSYFMTNEKYLNDGKLSYVYTDNLLTATHTFDKIDEQLLIFLGQNARISFTEMAQKINLTPEAIAYRFNNLKRNKIIKGFKIRLDFDKLGLSYYHLFITMQDQSQKQKLISYYTAHPACNSIMQHVGFYDLHIELVLPAAELSVMMDDLLAKFGNALNGYELLHITHEHLLNMMK